MIQLIQEWDIVSWQELEDRAEVKRAKLSKWSELV
jgi:endonuclease/exonuclease/phosphatase family metal-dependent hydrolase